MQAQDVMTTEVVTVRASATVQEAARLMVQHRVSALPVVDGKGRLMGMVSEGDLVRRTELGTDGERSWWLRAIGGMSARDYLKTHGAWVRDVMTTPPVSVRSGTTLQKVASLLEQHAIKRMPVVEGGRVVGIVSRADLVRTLATTRSQPALPARSAADRALRREVLKQLRGAGYNCVLLNVTVESGVVHLWGGAGSRGEQKALAVIAKDVDGVRKVEDHTSVVPLQVATTLGMA
jgi:CBS domain-containing protein